jgi:hypothetical protein
MLDSIKKTSCPFEEVQFTNKDADQTIDLDESLERDRDNVIFNNDFKNPFLKESNQIIATPKEIIP